jgi:atypical dual specificity phosphatase
MIQTTSRYYDGPIEGVYVKVEKDGIIVDRGKVVRGDFISGNEHWTRGNLRENGLAVDLHR